MKKYLIYLLILTGVVTFSSCKDMNSFHEPYLKNPTVYRAKPDTIFIHSGNKRAEINWELSIDESIIRTIITVDGKDSHEYPIGKRNEPTLFTEIITGLSEGNHIFTIHNEDDKGNSSLPVNVYSEVFGDTYQAGLTARGYNKITTTLTETKINWNSAYVGDAGLELTYINDENVPVTLLVSKDDSETILTNIKSASTVTYKSFYKPNKNSIDSFVVEKSFVLPN